MIRANALVTVAILVPRALMACTPAPFDVSDAPILSGACSVRWSVDAYRSVGLGPNTNMGAGFVLQDYFDGNACYWNSGLVIQDCTTGRAMIIGTDRRALMDGPQETGIDRISATLDAERGAHDLDSVALLARAEGYGPPEMLERGQILHVGEVPLPRDCACKSLYPETAGGTE